MISSISKKKNSFLVQWSLYTQPKIWGVFLNFISAQWMSTSSAQWIYLAFMSLAMETLKNLLTSSWASIKACLFVMNKICVFLVPGHDTKVLLNNQGPRLKRSKVERLINRDVLICVLILFVICLMSSIGKCLQMLSDQLYSVVLISAKKNWELFTARILEFFFLPILTSFALSLRPLCVVYHDFKTMPLHFRDYPRK